MVFNTLLSNVWCFSGKQKVHGIGDGGGVAGQKRGRGQRLHIGRLCTGRSREALEIFLFCLEALVRRVSRAQSSADLSLP